MDIVYKELTADNLFDFCAVLDAVGVEEALAAFDGSEINSLAAQGKSNRDVGIVMATKLCGTLVKSLPNAKNEICEFLANCIDWEDGSTITAQEVLNFGAIRFVRVIYDLFKQEGVSDFFKEVAGFVSTAQTNSES
ncbi:MAG: hypothetical protein LUD19_01960 [Clostridia bacterium]|nr:hypothetical protein [Clostridia bacterium]